MGGWDDPLCLQAFICNTRNVGEVGRNGCRAIGSGIVAVVWKSSRLLGLGDTHSEREVRGKFGRISCWIRQKVMMRSYSMHDI